MTSTEAGDRIGILFRGDRRAGMPTPHPLFDPLAKEFAAFGVTAEPVMYADDAVEDARRALLRLGAVLVWVDPV